MEKLFDFEAVLSQLPEILKYLPTTLILAVSSMIIALIIGMLLALIKTKNIPVLKQIPLSMPQKPLSRSISPIPRKKPKNWKSHK